MAKDASCDLVGVGDFPEALQKYLLTNCGEILDCDETIKKEFEQYNIELQRVQKLLDDDSKISKALMELFDEQQGEYGTWLDNTLDDVYRKIIEGSEASTDPAFKVLHSEAVQDEWVSIRDIIKEGDISKLLEPVDQWPPNRPELDVEIIFKRSHELFYKHGHPKWIALQVYFEAASTALSARPISEGISNAKHIYNNLLSENGCIWVNTTHFIKYQALAADEADVGLFDAAFAVLTGAEDEFLEESINAKEQALYPGRGLKAFKFIEFKDQCILLSKVFEFSNYHKHNVPKAFPTSEVNSSLSIDGQPFGFINKLTQYPGNKEFFEMTNDEIANLQPLMRFFKVIGANKATSGIDKEIEISFDSYATRADVESIILPAPDAESILKNKNSRGFGVGIKNFSLTYDGSNFFAVKKSIKATLSIFANNFSELLKDREGIDEDGNTETYRYIDLVLKTGKTVKDKNPDQKELDFRLKAVFGYSIPSGQDSTLRPEVKTALKNNFVTINLTPVTHNFEFDEMGRVTLNIDYFAYVEEYFDKPRFNIFANVGNYLQILKRRLAFKSVQKTDCDTERISEMKEADSAKIAQEKENSFKFLMFELIRNDKILYFNLKREELAQMIDKGPFYKFPGGVSSRITTGLDQANMLAGDISNTFMDVFDSEKETEGDEEFSRRFQAAFRIADIDSVRIPFFYLGDLLDMILAGLAKFLTDTANELSEETEYEIEIRKDNKTVNESLPIDNELKALEIENISRSIEQFKKLRLLLGPIEIVNHRNPAESDFVNFADLPIAVSYFTEWMTKKVLSKNSAIYPLTQFLNDLFNDLIKSYLNDDSCFTFNIKQKIRLNQAVLTSYTKKEGVGEIEEAIIESQSPTNRLNIDTFSDIPLLNIAGHHSKDIAMANPGYSKEMNYFVFFAGRSQPQELMNGNKEEDESRGIFHYILGRDRGIVKNISLTKTSAPGLKEVRFEQEGFDGLTQLREIYDVNVDCFANVQTFPGTYIFIDPRGFSPSLAAYDINEFDLTDLGIGGYHMIIASEHNFGPGQANTTLTAKWVAALEKEDDEQTMENNVGSNDEAPKKCSAKRNAAPGPYRNTPTTPTTADEIDEVSKRTGEPKPSENYNFDSGKI